MTPSTFSLNLFLCLLHQLTLHNLPKPLLHPLLLPLQPVHKVLPLQPPSEDLPEPEQLLPISKTSTVSNSNQLASIILQILVTFFTLYLRFFPTILFLYLIANIAYPSLLILNLLLMLKLLNLLIGLML